MEIILKYKNIFLKEIKEKHNISEEEIQKMFKDLKENVEIYLKENNFPNDLNVNFLIEGITLFPDSYVCISIETKREIKTKTVKIEEVYKALQKNKLFDLYKDFFEEKMKKVIYNDDEKYYRNEDNSFSKKIINIYNRPAFILGLFENFSFTCKNGRVTVSKENDELIFKGENLKEEDSFYDFSQTTVFPAGINKISLIGIFENDFIIKENEIIIIDDINADIMKLYTKIGTPYYYTDIFQYRSRNLSFKFSKEKLLDLRISDGAKFILIKEGKLVKFDLTTKLLNFILLSEVKISSFIKNSEISINETEKEKIFIIEGECEKYENKNYFLHILAEISKTVYKKFKINKKYSVSPFKVSIEDSKNSITEKLEHWLKNDIFSCSLLNSNYKKTLYEIKFSDGMVEVIDNEIRITYNGNEKYIVDFLSEKLEKQYNEYKKECIIFIGRETYYYSQKKKKFVSENWGL